MLAGLGPLVAEPTWLGLAIPTGPRFSTGRGFLAAVVPLHAGLDRRTVLAGGAVLAVAAVGMAAVWWPRRRPPEEGAGPFHSWDGRLRPAQVVTRVISVALVAVAVVAGRLGSPAELENIASALVVGLGWPALLVLSAAGGPVWRWLDPWDAVARPLAPAEGEELRPDVWPAVLSGLLWTWYLSVYTRTLDPRSVGLALGVYALTMAAGSLAVGRRGWLPRADVFGLLFGWLSRLPRGALASWQPPRGAEALLGSLAGGLLFGMVRRSEVWGELNVVRGAAAYATLGMALSAAGVAVLLWALERWGASRGARGSVAAAALPAVGAVGVAVGMALGRLFTSLQLMPALAGDPFGRGWNLFGTRDLPIETISPPRLAALQLAVLLLGHMAGAIVLARRRPGTRLPAAVALVVLMAGSAWTMLLAPGI